MKKEYPIYEYDIEQQSKEWFNARKGCLSGSHAQEIANCGKGLETYVMQLMADYYATTLEETYTNANMERGIELEEQARQIYELENNCTVKKVGFVRFSEDVLASPDGLIDDDKIIEIKCHNNVNHFKLILDGEKGIDSKYIWQIQMNLLVTGRKLAIYLAYNPNFEKSLLVFRIKPDKEKHEKLLKGFEIGKKQIEDIKNKLK